MALYSPMATADAATGNQVHTTGGGWHHLYGGWYPQPTPTYVPYPVYVPSPVYILPPMPQLYPDLDVLTKALNRLAEAMEKQNERREP